VIFHTKKCYQTLKQSTGRNWNLAYFIMHHYIRYYLTTNDVCFLVPQGLREIWMLIWMRSQWTLYPTLVFITWLLPSLLSTLWKTSAYHHEGLYVCVCVCSCILLYKLIWCGLIIVKFWQVRSNIQWCICSGLPAD